MDPDSRCDSVPVIPVAILAEFEFHSEFCRNGNYNFAGTPAKIPFPWNSRNYPDSGRFQQEYMGDCKELPSPLPPPFIPRNLEMQLDTHPSPLLRDVGWFPTTACALALPVPLPFPEGCGLVISPSPAMTTWTTTTTPVLDNNHNNETCPGNRQ
jgi:hypothetical protein